MSNKFQEVWFANRSGTTVGVGTKASPYRAENLYSVCAGLFTKGVVPISMLMPGEYIVPGFVGHSSNGWFRGPVIGCGIDATVLKLLSRESVDMVPKHAAIGVASSQEAKDWQFSGFTVDVNSQNHTPNLALEGFSFNGERLTAKNIRVINTRGIMSKSQETWAGMIFGVDNRIDGCVAESFLGDYDNGFSADSSVNATISNNIVNSSLAAYLASTGKDTVIANNIARNCMRGFYTDTGYIEGLTIRGNRFDVKQDGMIIAHNHSINGLVIERNTLRIASRYSGFGFYTAPGALISDMEIIGNYIEYPPGKETGPALNIEANANISHVSAVDNRVKGPHTIRILTASLAYLASGFRPVE